MKRPARGTRSLRRSAVLLTAGATALGVMVLTLLTQMILESYTRSSVDSELHTQTTRLISTITAQDGTLQVPAAAVGSGTVVYDAEGLVIGGAPPGPLWDSYDTLSRSTATKSIEHRHVARVFADPFTVDGTHGVVVTSAALVPYERAERLGLLVSVVAGLLLVGASAAVAAVVSRRALAPVETMADTARQWSEHDLGQRFPLSERPDELTALAATLNLLLDRVDRAIRSEQRLTSELAHELRTPLTTVRGTAELMLMRGSLSDDDAEDLDAIRQESARMTDTINGLLDLARATPGELGEESDRVLVQDVVAALVAAVPEAPRITVTVPAGVGVRAPRTLIERALAPVLANALRFGTHVEVSATQDDAYTHITVTDDGPGVATELGSRIFEPGVSAGDGSGAGLGLPLARRLARSVGGDVVLDSAEAPTRFVVRLPA